MLSQSQKCNTLHSGYVMQRIIENLHKHFYPCYIAATDGERE